MVRWYREQAGPDTALRFADATLDAFAHLASLPGVGSPVITRRPELAGVRKWRVDGFSRRLIFYRPTTRGIRIVRVLHSAQNWLALLGAD